MHNDVNSGKKRIAVIGAGIAGLCTAYWLEKEGCLVQVFEKNNRPGGAIVTEREAGFLIDLGPNSTLETSEVLRDLVEELGLASERVYANEAAAKRYILRNGELMAVPLSPLAFFKTPLFSWKAKLRLLREPFIKPTTGDDIPLADFVSHRLGQEFLDFAINPFVAGVYAGDPKTLSTAAGFPKLYALEKNYGSLIKGAFLGARERKKRKEVAKDRAKMFSFINGMQTLTDTLADKLKIPLMTDTAVLDLEKQGGKFRLTSMKNGIASDSIFDGVVLCVPLPALSVLMKKIAPAVSDRLSEVHYPPVSVVFTGFNSADITRPLDGFGFLIPEKERRGILGSIWSSTIFPGRASEGQVAFTTFVGGTRQPENAALPHDELLALVLSELKSLVGVSGDPVFVKIKKWEKAIPQYTLGYRSVQALFDEMENTCPGLYFAGNFRRGISVGDSVLSAHETAQKIAKNMQTAP